MATDRPLGESVNGRPTAYHTHTHTRAGRGAPIAWHHSRPSRPAGWRCGAARWRFCCHAVTLSRAALAAGTGTDASPDAELIRLCDRLVAIRAEERAITDADAWVPDRGPYKARFDALLAEWFAIDARLYDVDEPVTRARVLAVARAAVAQAPKQADGVNRRPRARRMAGFHRGGIRGAGGRGMTRKAAKRLRADKLDPYICIPMIEETPSDAKAGRNFWAVKRTGDYAFDCALGERLARVTGHVIAREHLADPLRAVILNMVKQGDASGVEVGFLSTITRAAARGWQA